MLNRVQHDVVRFTAALLPAAGRRRSRSICARHLERQHSACATRRGFLPITQLPRQNCERRMPKARGHSWRFKTRFRRHAFGWKSQPAITRLQEALSEIKQVARLEPVLAAEGAIALLERISPALEHVDSSSGAIGSAVNRTIAELVPVIAGAPADARTRAAWLDRLFEAHAADQIPYIEQLAEYWGELCGSRELASEWADRLIDHHAPGALAGQVTRGYFHGTSACLSALFTAGRYEELIELVKNDVLWPTNGGLSGPWLHKGAG